MQKQKVYIIFDSRGFILPLVLGIIAVLLILSFSAYSLSMNNQQMLSKSLHKDIALYNAESAYNQALWQINSIGYLFYKVHDTNPKEIEFNSEPYRLYRLPDGDNNRLEVLVPLLEVPGRDELKEDNNNLIIRATGWDTKTPNYLRTIEVKVYKRTFTQHALVNENERVGGTGQEIVWTTGDTMYGPLHTNDILFISGTPAFYGPVTYTVGINPSNQANNTSIFRQGAEKTDKISLPATNPELKAHSLTNGHYYKGRTCIYLVDGGYNVRTYDTRDNTWKYNNKTYEFITTRDGDPTNTNVNNYWTEEELNAEAATSGNMFRYLDDGNNWRAYPSFQAMADAIPPLPLPLNEVIYVDGNTGNGTTGSNNNTRKMDRALGNVFVAGRLDGQLTITAANDIYVVGRNPCDWSKPPNSNLDNWLKDPGVTYKDTSFEQVFIRNDWDHTRVNGMGEDMLGLVADRKVHLLHYVWPSGYDKPTYKYTETNRRGQTTTNKDSLSTTPNYYWDVSTDLSPHKITIYAAIYAGTDSFGFEEYDKGSVKGDLEIVGSITQQIRGPIGTVNTSGYKKDYSHDPRMLLDAPPFYPLPDNIGWLSSHWNESDDHILAKDD